MTALWTIHGRAVLAACLLLLLLAAAPAPAATHVDRLLARDDHKRGAFTEVRALRAAKARAEARAREAVLAATTAAPAQQPATTPVAASAEADAGAERRAAERRAERRAAERRAERRAAERRAKAKAQPKPKATSGATAKGDGERGAEPAPVADYDESKPLDLPTDVEAGPARADTSGGSLGRTLFGLLVVVGLIYGLTHVLRRMRQGAIGAGRGGDGLKAVASIPLGPNRSIHLVRAGQEYLLVGAAEHGVVPLRTYTEDEARAAGLLDLDARRAAAPASAPDGEPPAGPTAFAARSTAPKLDLGALVAELRSRTVRR